MNLNVIGDRDLQKQINKIDEIINFISSEIDTINLIRRGLVLLGSRSDINIIDTQKTSRQLTESNRKTYQDYAYEVLEKNPLGLTGSEVARLVCKIIAVPDSVQQIGTALRRGRDKGFFIKCGQYWRIK